jgi:UDP-glucose 4-epimerase
MDSILVTGSLGFIGREIIKKITKTKIITDSNNSKRINLQNINEVLEIDPADTVIHLAGKTPKRELKWNDYFENNVFGTLNILEYCIKKNVKKLIYVSSYVYGNPEYCPIDESHPVNPHNAYSKSKFLGEQLCKFYCDNSDLSVIILRPFNIFGESMNDGFLLTNLANAIKTRKKITIINKNSKRDFLHIDDFVECVLKAIDYDTKFDIFNVGTGISFSFDEIIEKIEFYTSKKINLEFFDDQKIFIEDIKADISKIRKKINWIPKVKFDEGLKKMLK